MFRELVFKTDVVIPTKDIDKNGLFRLRSFLAERLLKNLLYIKSSEKDGYYLTVTSLKCTGKKKNHSRLRCVLFPITFTCRTYLPCAGETMVGVVYMIHETGAILRCGPMRCIFLSRLKMADHQTFIPGEKAAFLNDSLSRIAVDVVIRFKVLGVRWVAKNVNVARDFQVLASLVGDSLGPVSLAGYESDDMELL